MEKQPRRAPPPPPPTRRSLDIKAGMAAGAALSTPAMGHDPAGLAATTTTNTITTVDHSLRRSASAPQATPPLPIPPPRHMQNRPLTRIDSVDSNIEDASPTPIDASPQITVSPPSCDSLSGSTTRSRRPLTTNMSLSQASIVMAPDATPYREDLLGTSPSSQANDFRRRSHSAGQRKAVVLGSPSLMSFDTDPYAAFREFESASNPSARPPVREVVVAAKARLPTKESELFVAEGEQFYVIQPADENGWLVCESCVSGKQGQVHTSDLEETAVKKTRETDFEEREKIANEFLSTERTYILGLNTIMHSYYDVIVGEKVLSGPDLAVIFPATLLILLDGHEGLLSRLEVRVMGGTLRTKGPAQVVWAVPGEKWNNNSCLGDLFTNEAMTGFFSLYGQYCLQFSAALEALERCRSASEPFQRLLSEIDQFIKNPMGLGSLLLTPVQRLPRYLLLLKQMLKHTGETHGDWFFLGLAHERLQRLSSEANTYRDQLVQSVRLFNLQRLVKRIPQHIFSSKRSLVHEVEVEIDYQQQSDGSIGFRGGRLFLLNDSILLTRTRNAYAPNGLGELQRSLQRKLELQFQDKPAVQEEGAVDYESLKMVAYLKLDCVVVRDRVDRSMVISVPKHHLKTPYSTVAPEFFITFTTRTAAEQWTSIFERLLASLKSGFLDQHAGTLVSLSH